MLIHHTREVSVSDALDGERKIDLNPSLWPLLNLSTETAYVALRRQHYGERSVDLLDQQGIPLGYFMRADTVIRGIPIKFIHPLIGWESTGWVGCDSWSADRWEQALRQLRGTEKWDLFQSLWQSPTESAQLGRAALATGMPHLIRSCPLRVIHGFRSWDEYYQSLSKKKRDRYKNSLKPLQKLGLRVGSNVSYEQIQNLYIRRILRMPGSDNAKTSRYQEFLKDWLQALIKDNRLETVGIWQGDRLVAMALGFWRDRIFFFNFTAYDPEFRAASPGSIAIYKIIEVALNKGAELFSFMGNFEYEKLYSSQVLETHRVDVFSRSLKGRLLHALMKFKKK